LGNERGLVVASLPHRATVRGYWQLKKKERDYSCERRMLFCVKEFFFINTGKYFRKGIYNVTGIM
jgi:hypothetical protein